jgi:hypothetical protein
MLVKKVPASKIKKGKVDGGAKDDPSPEEHPEAARLCDIVDEFETIGNGHEFLFISHVTL